MLTNVLFGCLKQVGHKVLGQPDHLFLQSHIDFDPAVFRFIDVETDPYQSYDVQLAADLCS